MTTFKEWLELPENSEWLKEYNNSDRKEQLRMGILWDSGAIAASDHILNVFNPQNLLET